MRLNFFSVLLLTNISIWFVGCTDKPELSDFTTTIRNDSDERLTVRGFNTPNELVLDETLNDGQTLDNCVTPSEVLFGLGCAVDSLIVEFENGNGYICANRLNSNTFCFENSPLLGTESHFNQIGD